MHGFTLNTFGVERRDVEFTSLCTFNFLMTKEMICTTLHIYAATFKQLLHIEYTSPEYPRSSLVLFERRFVIPADPMLVLSVVRCAFVMLQYVCDTATSIVHSLS